MKRHAGFTLIELMIVIAIIAILAAIALPAYQNYVGRSQVSESLVLMDGARAAIVEYYSGHGQFPPSQSSAGMPQATSIIGKYVSKVVLAPNTGALTATMFGAGIVSGCVQGRTVTLTPTAPTVGSESILWKCSSNIPPVCLPSTCPG